MYKVSHPKQNPGELQCLGLRVSIISSNYMISSSFLHMTHSLYSDIHLRVLILTEDINGIIQYLFCRLTDEDMAVMNSLVSIA